MKIFKQIFVGHLIVVALAVGILSILLSFVVEHALYMQKVNDLKELSQPIVGQLQKNTGENQRFLRKLDAVLRQHHIYLIIFDSRFHATYPLFTGGQVTLPDDVALLLKQGKTVKGQRKWLRRRVTWVIDPVGPHGKDGAVMLYSPVEGLVKTMRQIRIVLMVSALIAFFISLAVSGGFARHLARRIKKLRQGTMGIRQGDYGSRVPVSAGGDEIDELARDFNQMAAKLEQTDRELRAFEEKRQQFILDLSHELRTPLTSIRGWLEALRKNYVHETEKPQIYENMEKETMRLIRLIHELMDLEKIRAGKVELKRNLYEVRDLFELVQDTLSWMAEEKGISLRVELPDHDRLFIYGDYDRLLQILVNLAKNGLQFTTEGEVVLSAGQTETETVIRVRDTGIGMKEEEMERIWERFYKADPSRARNRGETGLGLSIVKQLVELHGGEISVASEWGKGTCFTLKFPFSSSGHDADPFSS
jgi:signal transduction histidine kinase